MYAEESEGGKAGVEAPLVDDGAGRAADGLALVVEEEQVLVRVDAEVEIFLPRERDARAYLASP